MIIPLIDTTLTTDTDEILDYINNLPREIGVEILKCLDNQESDNPYRILSSTKNKNITFFRRDDDNIPPTLVLVHSKDKNEFIFLIDELYKDSLSKFDIIDDLRNIK